VLSSGVIIWCHHLVSSSGVIIWCHHLVSSFGVIIWCHHLVSSSGAIINGINSVVTISVVPTELVVSLYIELNAQRY